jgi:hypothetical protein
MGSGAKLAIATAAGLAAATVAGLATSDAGRRAARKAKTGVRKMINSPTGRSVRRTINETVDQVIHPDLDDLNAMRTSAMTRRTSRAGTR